MRRKMLGLSVALAGVMAMTGAQAAETAYAIFAGGCFWSIESDFDHAPGVVSTTSGYIGGHVDNPSYEQVVTETTGHREAVKIGYDPAVTSYEKLLDTYFHLIDPMETRGQFCDFGESYTTAIYAGSDTELKEAEAAKEATAKALGKPVATLVEEGADVLAGGGLPPELLAGQRGAAERADPRPALCPLSRRLRQERPGRGDLGQGRVPRPRRTRVSTGAAGVHPVMSSAAKSTWE